MPTRSPSRPPMTRAVLCPWETTRLKKQLPVAVASRHRMLRLPTQLCVNLGSPRAHCLHPWSTLGMITRTGTIVLTLCPSRSPMRQPLLCPLEVNLRSLRARCLHLWFAPSMITLAGSIVLTLVLSCLLRLDSMCLHIPTRLYSSALVTPN